MSERQRSVIHDIGYRSYAGSRLSSAAVTRSLFRQGLATLFGVGRSGKAKILPFALLVITLLPALVMVGILVVGDSKMELNYAGLPLQTRLLTSLFVATQAPLLFSADQRSGVIALYFARPAGPIRYALARFASLVAAVLIFLLSPMILLFVGGLLAGREAGPELKALLIAVGMGALLATALGGIGAAVTAFATRRGFATLGVISVLLILDGVVAMVQAIALADGSPHQSLADWAGLASPYALYAGLLRILQPGTQAAPNGSPIPAPEGAGVELLYWTGLGLFAAATMLATLWRIRKVAGR